MNITEAKAHLSKAINYVVSQNEEVIIYKGKDPVAKLIKYDRLSKNRRIGAYAGQIKIADDFDEWPEDFKETFGL